MTDDTDDMDDTTIANVNEFASRAKAAIDDIVAAYRDAKSELRDAKDELSDAENAECESCENLKLEIAGLKTEVTDLDGDKIERLVSFEPGDPGKLYPLGERVAGVLGAARAERDAAVKARTALEDAIIPELTYLEGCHAVLEGLVKALEGRTLPKAVTGAIDAATAALGAPRPGTSL